MNRYWVQCAGHRVQTPGLESMEDWTFSWQEPYFASREGFRLYCSACGKTVGVTRENSFVVERLQGEAP